ncbi:MAG: hypothetical protein ACD_60C00025G0042 [uncultured bacterium]|nr:MAG: hypothetical protein ACD_60C00025G0042 [uncultured bacterium]
MPTTTSPSYVAIDPPTTPPKACVIWLHGLGADGHDFIPIVPELTALIPHSLRFVFPHAPLMPVTINNGAIMRAWYDIASFEINRPADHAGIKQSIKKLHQLIEQEEKSGIPIEKIILAGFSQGAVIALTAGLTFPKPIAGIIALSGYLPPFILTSERVKHTSIPIFLGHGQEDPIVPYALGEMSYETLKNEHYEKISWHHYPMPHSVCAEEIQDIAKWITCLFH